MATVLDLTTLNLPEGTHTITVKAKGNKLKSSVASAGVSYTIEPLMPTVPTPSVELDGSTLKIYDESGVCEEFDIIVNGSVVKTLSVKKMISFTIEGVSYRAEEGMTWNAWCASEYNTGGYTNESGADGVFYGEDYMVERRESDDDYILVEGQEPIISSKAYYHWEYEGLHSSGSGN